MFNGHDVLTALSSEYATTIATEVAVNGPDAHVFVILWFENCEKGMNLGPLQVCIVRVY